MALSWASCQSTNPTLPPGIVSDTPTTGTPDWPARALIDSVTGDVAWLL
jgi:hypothetical protein